jgi:23S rRNA pseudouridine1911/1915/1917 synthase
LFPIMKPSILFENENFVVVDKPSGMLSIPDRTRSQVSLKDLLAERYDPIFTVHRLDRDTSGIILFARNEDAHRHLNQQFEDRSTQKIYQGLLLGKVNPESGRVDEPISDHYSAKGLMMTHDLGKPASTAYQLLEGFKGFSWMQFQIFTGRTHQIRVHMKHLGHPLACDELYGDGKPLLLSSFKKKFKLSKLEEEERPLLRRLALHAHSIRFHDPSGREWQFEAPLPKDLSAVLQQLRKWNS